MILGITGSRSFQENPPFNRRATLNLFEQALNILKPETVIHGGAEGPDTWAQKWATGRGIQDLAFLPITNSRANYLARNRDIVYASDVMLVCWDEVSGGTGYTYDFAYGMGTLCHTVPIFTGSRDGSESDTVRRYRREWLTALL